MEKLTQEQISAALASLPEKQRERIYRHCVLGISNVDIARVEGVAKSRVTESMQRGLRNMKKYLENPLSQEEQKALFSHGY